MIARTALHDLSRSTDEDPSDAVRRLYVILVKLGVWLHVTKQAAGPLDYALQVAAGHFPMGLVLPEISRRGAQHPPGFAAAVVRLAQAVRVRTDGHGDMQCELEALEELESRARRHLPGAVRQRLQEAVPMIEVAGQIPLTVYRHWGGTDPLRVLADALSGGLDYAPIKIASDVQDQARSHRTDIDREQRDVEITIQEVRSRSRGAKRNGRPALLTPEDVPLTHDEREELLRGFVAAHPEHAEGIQFGMTNDTDTNLAHRHGCTRQTIYNRRERAKRAFEEFRRSAE
jgi:hypothetical protein